MLVAGRDPLQNLQNQRYQALPQNQRRMRNGWCRAKVAAGEAGGNIAADGLGGLGHGSLQN